jgi:hypothetical protein
MSQEERVRLIADTLRNHQRAIGSQPGWLCRCGFLSQRVAGIDHQAEEIDRALAARLA